MMLIMAKETEDKDLDLDTVSKGVAYLFDRPKYGKYFMADVEVDGVKKTVGTTGINFEMQPRVGGLVYMIESVFVYETYRRNGIFRRLYNHVIS